MSNTSDFRNGLIIEHKNNLFKIIEFQHVKPGKGGAFVRTKLKNIKTGQIIDETFRSGANISVIRIEAREFNYLYNDESTYFFMDNETYEQIELQKPRDNLRIIFNIDYNYFHQVRFNLLEKLENTISPIENIFL